MVLTVPIGGRKVRPPLGLFKRPFYNRPLIKLKLRTEQDAV